MRKNTLLICLLLHAGITYAQTDTLECDKPDRDTTEAKALPWFDDNDYLEDFLDSIGYPSATFSPRIVGTDRVRYHIPVKFWVYRSSAGIGGPNIQQLRDYIDNH